MERYGPNRAKRVPLTGRRQIWASSTVVVLAIVIFGALGVRPLVLGRTEDRRARSAVLVLQEISELRTALSAWQVYVEPHFAAFSSTAGETDATQVGKAGVLAAAQAAQAPIVIKSLRAVGLSDNADQLQTSNATYAKSIADLVPLYGGATPAAIASGVAAETTAFTQMLTTTSNSATVLRARAAEGLAATADRLDNGRKAFLVADAFAIALTLGGAFVLGQRARRRECSERKVTDRHEFEATLQDALEMAKTESDTYGLMTRALGESVPNLQVEMLVADSSRAHFHQTLHTATDGDTARSGCSVTSPVDCPATRRGHTLVFASSSALNACPYLKERPSGELAAACIPISITGQTAGVVHATAPDGAPPTAGEIDYLEVTARRASDRIAMLRAFEKSEAQARTDPLTGLWNRRSLENRINDLQREGTPYALAYGDLDNFKALNDAHGHEAGDQALRLFSRVLRAAIRPGDITARYGGEEFLVVLPDCDIDTATKILERLREELALTLTTGRVPSFTVSFGLASSVDADTFDEVVALADGALLTAKVNGRNRTVLAANRDAQSQSDPVHASASPDRTA
jgi:diguanylate cyclase (GGDEF)-like protein